MCGGRLGGPRDLARIWSFARLAGRFLLCVAKFLLRRIISSDKKLATESRRYMGRGYTLAGAG